jgi:peptide/nickel transport system substrate-binding protein
MSALTSVTRAYNTGEGGGSGQSAQVYWPAFDGLVWVDREGRIQPGLARAWETTDARTWTFRLRDDIRFHDNTPLEAKHVVETFNFYRDPTKGQQAVALFGNVDTITATDPRTVTIVLRQPAPSFAKAIALALVTKGDELQSKGATEYFRNPIGTGAYRVVRVVQSQEVAFEAMPPGFVSPRQAAVRELVFKDVPEASTRLAGALSGDTDIAYTINVDQIRQAESGNLTVQRYLGSAQNHLTMNVTERPFNDIKVRQALNHAIDRQSIINNIFQGNAQIDTQLIGSAVLGFNPQLQPYPFDQNRARQLLAEAGFPNGFRTTLTYTAVTPTQGTDSAPAIAADLARVGVQAELRLTQSPEWLDQYFGPPDRRQGLWAGTTNWEQTFEAESVWRWWSDEVAVGTATERGGRRWENPEFFQLYRTAKATVNEADRGRAYQAAGRYLYDQVPVVFLWIGGNAVAYNGRKLDWTPGLFADIWTPQRLIYKQ